MAHLKGNSSVSCVDCPKIVTLITPLPGYFPNPQLLNRQFSLLNRKEVWQIRLGKLMSRKFEDVRSRDIKNQTFLPYEAPRLMSPVIIGHSCAHTAQRRK